MGKIFLHALFIVLIWCGYGCYQWNEHHVLKQSIPVTGHTELQKNADSEKMTEYNALITDGNRLLAEEKWTEASAIFKKALEIDSYEFTTIP